MEAFLLLHTLYCMFGFLLMDPVTACLALCTHL
jgi:hypothetical protein